MIGKIERILFENEKKDFFIAQIKNVFGSHQIVKIYSKLENKDKHCYLNLIGEYQKNDKYGLTFTVKSFTPFNDESVHNAVNEFKRENKIKDGLIITKLKHYSNNDLKSNKFYTGYLKESYFNIVIDNNIKDKITKTHNFMLKGYWFKSPGFKEDIFFCESLEKVLKSPFNQTDRTSLKKMRAFI